MTVESLNATLSPQVTAVLAPKDISLREDEAGVAEAVERPVKKARNEPKRPPPLKGRKPIPKSELFAADPLCKLPSPELYYFERGFRKVKPYLFKYKTYVKQRMLHRKLIDIFRDEFAARPMQYYEDAIRDQRLQVNDESTCMDYVVRDGDYICHLLTRVEPPVLALPIEVLHRDEEVIVVNKPPSLPVHPTGRYQLNSMSEVLQHEMKLNEKVNYFNRLDSHVSGVMVIPRNQEKMKTFQQQLTSGQLEKEYIALVKGHFPESGGEGPDGRDIVCRAPLGHVSVKLGVMGAAPDTGKPAESIFRLLAFDGNQSLVHCRPITGKTHQLRVHLQYLGFPIVQDTLYSDPSVWGDSLGKGGVPESEFPQLSDRIDLMVRNRAISRLNRGLALQGRTATPEEIESARLIDFGDSCSPLGTFCEPLPEELVLCLHAVRYAGPDWSFASPLPGWSRGVVARAKEGMARKDKRVHVSEQDFNRIVEICQIEPIEIVGQGHFVPSMVLYGPSILDESVSLDAMHEIIDK